MKRQRSFEATNSSREAENGSTKKRLVESGDGQSSASVSSSTPATNQNAIHGNLFQLKLLMLFLIRGIGKEYEFHLGTEIPEHGKFDDLVFKYEVQDKNDSNSKHWRYLYLQAKHRQNKDKSITSSDLLAASGDFSLSKYFHSYRQDIINPNRHRRPEDIDSCIICTNVKFDEDDLKNKGIEFAPLADTEGHSLITDKILSFEQTNSSNRSILYQLKITEHLSIKMKEAETRLLGEKLHECATKTKQLNSNNEPFKRYHLALVKEHVIDLQTKRFHTLFVNKHRSLSTNAKQLREIFDSLPGGKDWRKCPLNLDSKFGQNQSGKSDQYLPKFLEDQEIVDFLSKLIFAVNTPNEVELDEVLKSEVVKYFKLHNSDLLSENFLKEMLDWFKKLETGWITSQKGKDLLNKGLKKLESLCFISRSLDYHKELAMILQFNQDAIFNMAKKLFSLENGQLFLLDPSSPVMRITSLLRECTAAKVLAALNLISEDENIADLLVGTSEKISSLKLFTQCKDSYLVTPSSRLLVDYEKFKEALSAQNSHNLLIIVCDHDEFVSVEKYANLISDHEKEKKKVVIIGNENNNRNNPSCLRDTITYHQLNEDSTKMLLSKEVSFQGSNQTVGKLIGDSNPEEVIDDRSIEELLKREKVKIPLFKRPRFQKSLYVKRRVTQYVLTELNTNDVVLLRTSNTISEDELFLDENKAIAIFNLAGVGKTTVLSHFYEDIKCKNPDHWVILMDLPSHSKILSELQFAEANISRVIESFPTIVTNNSPFTRALLRDRLQTGDRIIVMLDGFDEIDSKIQEKAIQLMRTISQTTLTRLFVTTRPNMDKILETTNLFQFYSLEDFNEDDQINYLTDYWIACFEVQVDQGDSIKTIAESLIKYVSENVKDNVKGLLGVPLQCRILAESYQSELEEILRNRPNRGQQPAEIENFLNLQNFDVIGLYRKFMETKRKIFREEKANLPTFNEITDKAIEYLIKKIESYLTKLAIETIFTEQKQVDILWPPSTSHKSEAEKTEKEKSMAELSLKFGLTFREGENVKVQFIHRTFPEYLVVEYLYKGFLLDSHNNNKLLEKEAVRKLIVYDILLKRRYEGGVQIFFDSALKRVINDGEWREIINRNSEVPDQLKKLAQDLSYHISAEANKGQLRSDKYYFTRNNDLAIALNNENASTFLFLCDCLSIAVDKAEVRRIFKSWPHPFNLSFYKQSSEVFKKFLDFFDDDADSDPDYILKKMMHETFRVTGSGSSLSCSDWSPEEKIKIVQLVLNFLDKHKESWKRVQHEKQILCSKEEEEENEEDDNKKYVRQLFRNNEIYDHNKSILHLFMCNENYENHLKQFLKLLSWIYSDDNQLTFMFKETFVSIEFGHYTCTVWSNGKIEKALNILKCLGRYNLLANISGRLLFAEKEVFQRFYLSEMNLLQNERQINIRLLSERNLYGMTLLHRAAFIGDTTFFEKLQETVHRLYCTDSEVRDMAQQVVDSMARVPNYCCTPFYVAATCGRKEVCHMILEFLKKTLSDDQLQKDLLSANGFLHAALCDGLFFGKIEMSQMILESVKQILGHKYLIDLLKSTVPEEESFALLYGSFIFGAYPGNSSYSTRKEWFRIMTEVILKDNRCGYDELNDLLFLDENSLKNTLAYIEDKTLQKMLSVKGIGGLKRFFDFGTLVGFYHLTSDPLDEDRICLHKFNNDQIEQFFRVITSTDDGREMSYWAEMFKSCIVKEVIISSGCSYGAIPRYSTGIFECLLKRQGENAVKELLLQNEGIIYRALLWKDSNHNLITEVVIPAINLLSDSSTKMEVINCIMKRIIQTMQEMFFDSKFKSGLCWMNILPFIIKYEYQNGINRNLTNCIDLISSTHNLEGRQCSIWGEYFDVNFSDEDCRYQLNKVENVKEFLRYVSEKLGNSTVKDLLLHNNNGSLVFHLAVSKGIWRLPEAMLACLSNEDREEIQDLILLQDDQDVNDSSDTSE